MRSKNSYSRSGSMTEGSPYYNQASQMVAVLLGFGRAFLYRWDRLPRESGLVYGIRFFHLFSFLTVRHISAPSSQLKVWICLTAGFRRNYTGGIGERIRSAMEEE